MKKHFTLILFSLFLLSCGKKELFTRSYYFPYLELMDPKIYKYVDAKDSGRVMYWNFKTEILQGDTILSVAVYNKEFNISSLFINKINDDGVQLKEMYVNPTDSNTLYKCMIKMDEVFYWKIKKDQSLYVSYSISNKDKTETEEVVSEKTFERKKENVDYNGKTYECLLVKEKNLINHIKINRTLTEEQTRNSYFAAGIGLIQFETFNADGSNNIFKLEKIFSIDEWNKMLPEIIDTAKSN